MKEEILGAIDIGSNAIRLLISTIDETPQSVDFKKTAFLRVPIRLGEDVFTKKQISDEKKERLYEAFSGFSHIMKAYQVCKYRACATSAMRDAQNGEDIVDAIRNRCGIAIDIIGGQEEGRIIFEAGGLDKMMDKNQSYLYVDVGGGSTEIALYNNQQIEMSSSFQLGTVRMLSNAVNKKEKEDFKKYLEDIYSKHYPMSIIASGGNINKIHKLLGKREGEFITYAELKVLYDTLKDMDYEERMFNYKLKSYRADVIVPALKIFTTICKICKVNQVHVPKVGLADGIIHHLYYENK